MTKSKVQPLKLRAMALDDLQKRTLKILRQVRKQFGHHEYEPGMTDAEFIQQVLDPFERDIKQDREMRQHLKT